MTDTPSFDTLLGLLIERLFALLKSDSAVWVVIDRYHPIAEDLQAAIARADLADTHRRVLHDPIFGTAHERAPEILHLETRHLPLVDLLAEHQLRCALDHQLPAPTVCGWLTTSASAAALAEFLRRRFDLWLPNWQHVYLSYHDPRVLPHLHALLNDAQRTRLLCLVSQWLLLGREGELIELQNPQSAPWWVGDLALTAQQSSALSRIEPLNQTLRWLARRGLTAPRGAELQLDQAMVQAQNRGLTQTADLGSYAALAWTWPAERGPMAQDDALDRGVQLALRGVPLGDYLDAHFDDGAVRPG